MAGLNKRTLQRIRVPLGFVFAAIFIVFSRPTLLTLVGGGVIAALGIAIRAWASGHIQKAKVLATSGPYGYTRNPLYLGSFVLGVGFTIAAGVWWLALIFIALYLGIYLPVMRVEEDDISRIFGAEFDGYRRNVPLFVPRFTVWKATGTKFDPALYFRYREYRAGLGALIAIALLAAKGWYLG
jgi:protein-S-isoprenylcysteine O-methyltransferase Ste14